MEDNKLVGNNVQIEYLVKSVLEGTSTESETGLVLRMIQTSISGALVTGLNSLMTNVNKLQAISERAMEKFITKVAGRLDEDMLDLPELTSIINTVQSRQLQVLDLYRKVAQGKELFPTDAISEEEKKVVKLLKSFTTPAQKKKFIALCEKMLQEQEDNDFSSGDANDDLND